MRTLAVLTTTAAVALVGVAALSGAGAPTDPSPDRDAVSQVAAAVDRDVEQGVADAIASLTIGTSSS